MGFNKFLSFKDLFSTTRRRKRKIIRYKKNKQRTMKRTMKRTMRRTMRGG